MSKLELARENGSYIITEHNDERLYMITQLLINDTVRTALKKILQYASEIGIDEQKNIEAHEYKVTISPMGEEKLLITLQSIDHDERFETDMSIETLNDLIDDYEDALAKEAVSMEITRSQDTFSFTTDIQGRAV